MILITVDNTIKAIASPVVICSSLSSRDLTPFPLNTDSDLPPSVPESPSLFVVCDKIVNTRQAETIKYTTRISIIKGFILVVDPELTFCTAGAADGA
jgi:hypothetical protein